MRGWTVRAGRFVLGSYPPVPSAVLAVLWAYGVTGLFTGLLVSLPAPVLLHLYLYAGYLDAAGHGPDAYGLAAIAVAVPAAGHAELAGKLTRRRRRGSGPT